MVKTLRDYFNEGRIQELIKKRTRFFDKRYKRAIYVIEDYESNNAKLVVFYPYLKSAKITRDIRLSNHLDDPER